MEVGQEIYHLLLGKLTISFIDDKIVRFFEISDVDFDIEEVREKICERDEYVNRSFTINDLREICEIRHITEIKHFTTLNNAISILKRGFIPRNRLNAVKQKNEFNNDFRDIVRRQYIESEVSDNYRWDKRTDCVCFSVSRVNSYLLSAYMTRNNYKYCTITISVEMLFNYFSDQYYYYHNAATSSFREIGHYLNDLKYFNKMFYKHVGYVTSSGPKEIYRSSSMHSSYTTSSQAEILIKNLISPKYIKKITFNNVDDLLYFRRNKFVDDINTVLDIGNIYNC